MSTQETRLALRAVVFDYGMVLTGPQDPASHAELVRMTGLPLDRFEELYWADRHAYDEGKLTGLQFWQKIIRVGGLNLSEADIQRLNFLDGRMWSTVNEHMVAWQAELKQRGLLTGILSNMGDTVLEVLLNTHAWISNFDVQVWSYQLLLAKPDPAIYLHTLAKLGTQPEETLFLDDRPENISAAHDLGIQAIQFSNADKLRQDLIAAGLDAELPLP
jgi:putative hydrolase of the HAD superfamily